MGKPHDLAAPGERSLSPVQQSDNPKTVNPRVDTAPHCVETPTTPADHLLVGARESGWRQPGTIGSHPRIENTSTIYNSCNPGTRLVIPWLKTASHSVETQPHWPIAEWLGIVRIPAHPGEDRFACPDQKCVHTFTIYDNLGTKTVIPRFEPTPHGVETPAPLADR